MELRAARKAVRETSSGIGNKKHPKNHDRYSQLEDDFILQFKNAGHTWKEIAITMDRPSSSCRGRYRCFIQYQNPAALPDSKQRTAENDPTNMTILKMANEGSPFTRIAAQLCMSDTAVRHRYNAVCHPEDRTTGTASRPLTEREIGRIESLVRQHKSATFIAAELGRSTGSINQTLYGKRYPHLVAIRKSATRCKKSAIGATSNLDPTLSEIPTQKGDPYEEAQKRSIIIPSEARPRTRKVPRRMTLDERHEVYRLHKSGYSAPYIASQLGRSPVTIQSVLRAALETHGQAPLPLVAMWSPEQTLQLIKLRDGLGLSWIAVAKIMGRTQRSVVNKYRRIKAASGPSDSTSPVTSDPATVVG